VAPPEDLTGLIRVNLTSSAIQVLKRAIVTGVYPPGGRLPTEKVLAAQLGVTRSTVREALAVLDAAGFTVSRQGSGTFVTDFIANATLDMLMEMLGAGRPMTPGEARALMKFREVVILGFADAVAAGVNQEHLVALRGVIARERAASEPVALAELDYTWNEILARASGNVFYTLLMRSTRAVHLELGTVIFRELGDHEAIISTQEAIVNALDRAQRDKLHRALEIYLGGGTRIVADWLQRVETRAAPSVEPGPPPRGARPRKPAPQSRPRPRGGKK
jgi:GntR family transcriptional regulator, transcriptional repressor for pyruvate dehydrogenase complex